jgi:fatty acid desaturase
MNLFPEQRQRMENPMNNEQQAQTGTRPISLRPAVLSDGRDLSQTARSAIQAMSGARPKRFLFELALAWAVVIGAAWAATAIGHWAATVIAILIISPRQIVLALLLHEQVHRLGVRGRWGDLCVNVFVSYPLLATTVEDYAEVHLRHHKFFMTSRDPDFIRKSGPDWTFPMPPKKLLKLLLRDLASLNTIELIRGKTAPKGAEFQRPNPTPKWVRPVFYISATALITWLHAWTAVLLYWVLPILTLTQVLVRLLAAAEHEYGHEGAGVHHVTPLVRFTWWQRILVPDLNFLLHIYHHNHPGVSFSMLPKVHAIYDAEGKVFRDAVFQGAGAFLNWLCGGQQGRPRDGDAAQDRGTGVAP